MISMLFLTLFLFILDLFLIYYIRKYKRKADYLREIYFNLVHTIIQDNKTESDRLLRQAKWLEYK